MKIEEQVQLLKRDTAETISEQELAEKLAMAAKTNKQLRIKLGLDPTSTDIHLGHTVVLRKMRQFQDLGHKAVLIIGDYTARIGDPTGQNTTRPMLSPEQIKENAKTYFEQAGKILDTSDQKLEVRYNSQWLAEFRLSDTIKLTSKMTVGSESVGKPSCGRCCIGMCVRYKKRRWPLKRASLCVRRASSPWKRIWETQNSTSRPLKRHVRRRPRWLS